MTCSLCESVSVTMIRPSIGKLMDPGKLIVLDGNIIKKRILTRIHLLTLTKLYSNIFYREMR